MINRIGYACINTSLKPRGFQQCRINSVYKYGIEYLREKIINNLTLTRDILFWNIEQGIYMYRITSALLPLVDHKEILKDFPWRWQEDREILKLMGEIKEIVKNNNIRLSSHPDQFTVLNSPKRNVVENSINYLKHHYEMLNLLGGSDMIIHTGGAYGNKEEGMKRFIKVYKELPEEIRKMVRVENDDVSFNIHDILYISEETGVGVVLDIHHHRCNKIKEISYEDIKKIEKTWEGYGICPKMHISSGKEGRFDRRHSDYILEEDLIELMDLILDVKVDLMVESKAKEGAVLKIIDKIK